MKPVSITATLVFPWWWRGYVYTCGVFAALHGLDVDAEKVAATVMRHVKMKVKST